MFNPRKDPIMSFINFQPNAGKEAEYIYFCVDGFSFPALIEQMRALEIEIPQDIINFMNLVNTLNDLFKGLNLTFKFEGGIVMGARPANANDVTALQTKFNNNLSFYKWEDLTVLDKTGC